MFLQSPETSHTSQANPFFFSIHNFVESETLKPHLNKRVIMCKNKEP